jgi:c-di-GMP-binding flagellar brake protein YcgR
MPDRVERCQRRNFYRVSTVGLTLPRVECYTLLDPLSAVDAEIANRLEIERLIDTPIAGRIGETTDEPRTPVVGPLFDTTLVNIGGGGVGLIVSPADRASFESHRVFWLRIPLEPHVPAPLSVTARLRHTHIDSSQRLYAGLQFDFSANPPHEKFVVDQVCRYVAQVQREQLARQTSA